jgi:hypothetical protein
MSSGFDSPAALPVERCVLARRGWVGEKAEHFEHSVGLFIYGATINFPRPANGIGY